MQYWRDELSSNSLIGERETAIFINKLLGEPITETFSRKVVITVSGEPSAWDADQLYMNNRH
jgi:hypothetical protein